MYIYHCPCQLTNPTTSLYLKCTPLPQVMYLDPHTTQPASPEEGMEEGEVEEEEDCSYHCPRYR